MSVGHLAALAWTSVASPALPPLDQVVGWAAEQAAASTEGDDPARLRWSAVLPDLTLRLGTDFDVDIRDATVRTITEEQGLSLDAWARWRLSNLVYHPDELRWHRIDRLSRSVRTAAQLRAIDVYFERWRVEERLRTHSDATLVREALQLDARLDALTGGRYRRWQRTQRP